MARELDSGHFPKTCCVCAAVQEPHKERRRVSKALEFTALGQKLNEISQIPLKLPCNAIIIVCKRCNDMVAKAERLEAELDATRSKLVQLVISTLAHTGWCCSGFRFAKPSVRASVLMHSSRAAGSVDCSKD